MGSDIPQSIQVGDLTVPLPPGVTVADWALEKQSRQNPRIRSLLGCTHLLTEVLDSNYALLHCSRQRLQEIWRTVRRVGDLLQLELPPLLEEPSPIPSLEKARCRAQKALERLNQTVLSELGRFPIEVPRDRLIEIRRLLCICMGKVHAFLQDSMSDLLSADPRSVHDADYYLSKRFQMEIQDTEWLHTSVERFQDYLQVLEPDRLHAVEGLEEWIAREKMIPQGPRWETAVEFQSKLNRELVPRLGEILALKGIRFTEMQTLEAYASEIPMRCATIIEIASTGRATVESLKKLHDEGGAGWEFGVEALARSHEVLADRLLQLLGELNRNLLDLRTFVPFWLDQIEKRRALMLRRQ